MEEYYPKLDSSLILKNNSSKSNFGDTDKSVKFFNVRSYEDLSFDNSTEFRNKIPQKTYSKLVYFFNKKL